MIFGKIKKKKPLFFFYDFEFEDGELGILLTNNQSANVGLIDTGFSGYLLFPDSYKEKFDIIDEKIISYFLANGKEIKLTVGKIPVAPYGQRDFEIQTVLFGEVTTPFMGIEFLELLGKVTFDFTDKKVYF